MIAVLQRVSRAEVRVDGEAVGTIGLGLVVLLGVARSDTAEDAAWMADKIAALRIFPAPEGRMDLALGDVGGAVLLVSQFTLLADTRKGRRPSFTAAAEGPEAVPLYEAVARELDGWGIPVSTGSFGAHMEVDLTNDGPVTIVLDSADRSRPRNG
jgi:D-aminoacyl-tRNA deacylase